MQKYLEHIENKRRASVNDVLTSAQYKELKAIFEAYDKTSKGSISVDDFLKVNFMDFCFPTEHQ